MHLSVKIYTALFLLISAGTAAEAAQETYACEFTTRSSRGPVPETLQLRVDRRAYQASVQDSFTKQLFPTPVNADYESLGPDRFIVRWRLVGLNYKGAESKVTGGIVDYKLRIKVAGGAAQLTGVSREYFSDIHGKGRCQRVK